MVNLPFPIPDGIADVVFDDNLGATPAKGNLITRIIRLNPEYYNWLIDKHDDWLFYIVYHECGHILLQTYNEKDADAYASNFYLSSGRSPKQSVYAMSKIFDFNNIEQLDRLELQLMRAAEYDWNVNKNPNALKILNKMNQFIDTELDKFQNDASFLGFGKPLKKPLFKGKLATRIRSKINDFIPSVVSGLASNGAGGAVGSGLESLLGSGGSPDPSQLVATPDPNAQAPNINDVLGIFKAVTDANKPPAPAPDNKIMGMKDTTFYAVAGIVVVTLVVVLVVVMKPKPVALA